MTYAERADRFDAAMAAAVSGPDADPVLAGMLADPALDARERIMVAYTLGTMRGPAGSVALRAAFGAALQRWAAASRNLRSLERDVLCTCVIALARRDGPAATDVYLAAARHDNPFVREYGLDALVPAGDDSAWDDVADGLGELLGKKISPGGRRWDETESAIEYLARHAPRGSERAVRLVTLLRDRWSHLGGRAALENRWPGIAPGGSPPASIDLPAWRVPPPWWQLDPIDPDMWSTT